MKMPKMTENETQSYVFKNNNSLKAKRKSLISSYLRITLSFMLAFTILVYSNSLSSISTNSSHFL